MTTSIHERSALAQRPFRIRKSLKELVYRPRVQKHRQVSLPLPPLPPHDHTRDEYVYDILYECQRGLLQFDPSPWCDADMRYTPMDPKTYQLPDPTWEWVSKDWMVDMTDDVDEDLKMTYGAGWQYALKFHGAAWHGNYKHFRSFVRRRRWIRLRHRIQPQQNTQQQQQQPETDKSITSVPTRTLVSVDRSEESCSSSHDDIHTREQQLFERMHQCRLDRERWDILQKELSSAGPDFEDLILHKARDYMAIFDFENYKQKFIHASSHFLLS
ncbi:uncharacterized protein BYT42DRAFT_546794 [Radiomyces spectabilis]|uniref:uncharacterized protein n=1 Tax=Radiomyces spectabilis TaxID=64574 RepID=UPI00221ECFD8|nr:uncharacterized protein BYT42DRAFT_546794 [Radiomyces spectabilis]KAI8376065.1 hypothetical protein BYT42DRAFT_546794 [Radiomyces spectabilis]